MYINWVEGGNWLNVQSSGIQADYGGFHFYAFTMTVGMVAAILYSLYQFWKRKMPLNTLLMAVTVIIPASLFGASFFGKANSNGTDFAPNGFWALFAFWQGGLSIHGGVYAGIIAGIIIFAFVGRKTKISCLAYSDAIIPNILLGQIIGRWGNFFNHELTGPPIHKYGHLANWNNVGGFAQWDNHLQQLVDGNSSGLHLPDWMLQNTMSIYTGGNTTINGINLTSGDLVQMSPIFFYESLALLIAWLLITFIIPNIGKWLGKKPWKVDAKFAFSWKYTFKHLLTPWVTESEELTWEMSWNKGFVENVDQKAKDQYFQDIIGIQNKYESRVAKPWRWLRGWRSGQAFVYKLQQNHKPKFMPRWKSGQALIKANNPHGYAIPKAGLQAFAYIFAWNITRFFLELSRSDEGLFIMYNKPLSLGIIMGSAIIGLLGMIFTQWGIPQWFRKPGYLYEKEYFTLGNSEIEEFTPTKKKPQLFDNLKTKVIKTNPDKQKSKEQKAKEKLAKLEK